MVPSEIVLADHEVRAIEMIHVFLNKQSMLIKKFVAMTNESVDPFSLRTNAPRRMEALSGTWVVNVHGVGARFTSEQTREVVDAHVGLFDSPLAFDAWRLEQYARSIHSEIKDFRTIIERLVSLGFVCRHRFLAHHYEMPISGVLR